jgi:paraquat-inducible protein B
VTRRSRRVSIIWIVPSVAVAIGAWLAWDTLSKEGPTIKISFESGEGLQAGQSQLKYKDIVFGTVKSLECHPTSRTSSSRSRRPIRPSRC